MGFGGAVGVFFTHRHLPFSSTLPESLQAHRNGNVPQSDE
jgi:hypothetical protein